MAVGPGSIPRPAVAVASCSLDQIAWAGMACWLVGLGLLPEQHLGRSSTPCHSSRERPFPSGLQVQASVEPVVGQPCSRCTELDQEEALAVVDLVGSSTCLDYRAVEDSTSAVVVAAVGAFEGPFADDTRPGGKAEMAVRESHAQGCSRAECHAARGRKACVTCLDLQSGEVPGARKAALENSGDTAGHVARYLRQRQSSGAAAGA